MDFREKRMQPNFEKVGKLIKKNIEIRDKKHAVIQIKIVWALQQILLGCKNVNIRMKSIGSMHVDSLAH